MNLFTIRLCIFIAILCLALTARTVCHLQFCCFSIQNCKIANDSDSKCSDSKWESLSFFCLFLNFVFDFFALKKGLNQNPGMDTPSSQHSNHLNAGIPLHDPQSILATDSRDDEETQLSGSTHHRHHTHNSHPSNPSNHNGHVHPRHNLSDPNALFRVSSAPESQSPRNSIGAAAHSPGLTYKNMHLGTNRASRDASRIGHGGNPSQLSLNTSSMAKKVSFGSTVSRDTVATNRSTLSTTHTSSATLLSLSNTLQTADSPTRTISRSVTPTLLFQSGSTAVGNTVHATLTPNGLKPNEGNYPYPTEVGHNSVGHNSIGHGSIGHSVGLSVGHGSSSPAAIDAINHSTSQTTHIPLHAHVPAHTHPAAHPIAHPHEPHQLQQAHTQYHSQQHSGMLVPGMSREEHFKFSPQVSSIRNQRHSVVSMAMIQKINEDKTLRCQNSASIDDDGDEDLEESVSYFNPSTTRDHHHHHIPGHRPAYVQRSGSEADVYAKGV